jgi:hypothetical protein
MCGAMHRLPHASRTAIPCQCQVLNIRTVINRMSISQELREQALPPQSPALYYEVQVDGVTVEDIRFNPMRCN